MSFLSDDQNLDQLALPFPKLSSLICTRGRGSVSECNRDWRSEVAFKMAKLPLTTISVCLFMAGAEPQSFTIQTEHRQINVTVGETAIFSVKPSAAAKNGIWEFKGKNIGLWIGSSVCLSNEHKFRAEIFLPNRSLLLKSVTFSDSGEYNVTMFPEVGDPASETLTLHVLGSLLQTESTRINVSVGETALFTVKPLAAVKNGNWAFNGTNIALWFSSSVFLNYEYKSRAHILLPNGSLLLNSLTFSDGGEYTVTMVPEVGEKASATLTLQVLDQSNPRDNLNDGAIAGIAIALLLCLGFAIGISAWLIKRKSEAMKTPKQGQNTSSVASDRAAALHENSQAIYENIPRR
ncbi:uncharacterized protein LOC122544186 isoform X2 [Chiloscyllium plagiosum]|uniref:uncharacterized protein LOC122544186 isoform X2 n=1 Tax=Chiloscyllium plagiosum TaxID=36176 RepID=UPI001CB80939|nr:uncharacterized protein LOC122544186 isoform X2 [Chiloscyllium plagiosum]